MRTNRIKVRVTKEDINNGWPGYIEACPVALALKRITGKNWDVGGEMGGNIASKGRTHVILPERVVAWIASYDDWPVRSAPITFEIELP